jgi:hypothetical protein
VGAWGVGVFEDDHALDWVGSMAEAATLAPVVDALRAAEAAEYLEAPANAADWVRGQPLTINSPDGVL